MTNEAQLWNWLLFNSRRAATATMAIGIMLVLTVGIAESAAHRITAWFTTSRAEPTERIHGRV